jgi:hypothetical protein
MAVRANSRPDMFSELTREELLALTIKMDRAAAIGERAGYDQAVTTEIHGVQADLYDARARASYASAGNPGPGTAADRIAGLAFGKYVVTATPGPDANVQAGAEGEREAEAGQ